MPTIHSTAATNKDAVVFNQPPCHSKGLIVCHSDSVVDELSSYFKVVRDTVDADAFHDGVDLMPSPGPFSFFRVEHNAVLHFIEQAASLGISKLFRQFCW
jgi:hypothetical protein